MTCIQWILYFVSFEIRYNQIRIRSRNVDEAALQAGLQGREIRCYLRGGFRHNYTALHVNPC